jgi:hypothetical protein
VSEIAVGQLAGSVSENCQTVQFTARDVVGAGQRVSAKDVLAIVAGSLVECLDVLGLSQVGG